MMICQETCAIGPDTDFCYQQISYEFTNLINFNAVSNQLNLSCSVYIAFKFKEIIPIRQHLHGDMCWCDWSDSISA